MNIQKLDTPGAHDSLVRPQHRKDFAAMSQHSDYIRSLALRELAQIEAWAETLGVGISTEFDEAIHIPDIGRDRSDPATKGNGRKVLEAVLGLYYACFGFEPYGEPGEITSLRRLPKVKLAA